MRAIRPHGDRGEETMEEAMRRSARTRVLVVSVLLAALAAPAAASPNLTMELWFGPYKGDHGQG